MLTPQELIKRYQLQQHPEGGYYHEAYRSNEIIPTVGLPDRFNGQRPYSTAIYFLLEGNQCSTFHRIKSDECWHFYTGIGLHIYILYSDGRGEILKLGDDPGNGYSFQQIVPAGCWFAAKPVHDGGFSFVGCTVAPGFDFADFELASKEELVKGYSQYSEWINMLT